MRLERKFLFLSLFFHLFIFVSLSFFYSFSKEKKNTPIIVIDLTNLNYFSEPSPKKEKAVAISSALSKQASSELSPQSTQELEISVSPQPQASHSVLSSSSKNIVSSDNISKDNISNKINISNNISGNESKAEAKSLDLKREVKDKDRGEEHFLKANLGVIAEIIRKNLNYPYIARKMGWEGSLIISFILTPEGALKDLKVEKSSGFEVLDKNTLNLVQKYASYFPRPPEEVKVVLPVTYKLQ